VAKDGINAKNLRLIVKKYISAHKNKIITCRSQKTIVKNDERPYAICTKKAVDFSGKSTYFKCQKLKKARLKLVKKRVFSKEKTIFLENTRFFYAFVIFVNFL